MQGLGEDFVGAGLKSYNFPYECIRVSLLEIFLVIQNSKTYNFYEKICIHSSLGFLELLGIYLIPGAGHASTAGSCWPRTLNPRTIPHQWARSLPLL